MKLLLNCAVIKIDHVINMSTYNTLTTSPFLLQPVVWLFDSNYFDTYVYVCPQFYPSMLF